jgi:hypothetical protein
VSPRRGPAQRERIRRPSAGDPRTATVRRYLWLTVSAWRHVPLNCFFMNQPNPAAPAFIRMQACNGVCKHVHLSD